MGSDPWVSTPKPDVASLPMTNRTVHVRITGRVQGVSYRAWTEDAAAELGLRGWVRNRRDGSVEAVFSGSDAAVADMLVAVSPGRLQPASMAWRYRSGQPAMTCPRASIFRPTTE